MRTGGGGVSTQKPGRGNKAPFDGGIVGTGREQLILCRRWGRGLGLASPVQKLAGPSRVNIRISLQQRFFVGFGV